METNGSNIGQISINLRKTKENMNYYYRMLLRTGLAKRLQSYPHAIYELTDEGRRVKESFAHSDGAMFYRTHAKTVRFPILSFGSWKFAKPPKLKPMNGGWNFQDERIRNSYGEWNVRVQDNGTLIIGCPEKTTDNPDGWLRKVGELAQVVAQMFAESYQMKLGVGAVSRKGHKELVGSEGIAKLFGPSKIEDLMRIDISEKGKPRLEEDETSNQLEQVFVQLPIEMRELKEHLIKEAKVLDGLKQHWDIHLPLMQRMDVTQQKTQETLDKMQLAIDKLIEAVKELKK